MVPQLQLLRLDGAIAPLHAPLPEGIVAFGKGGVSLLALQTLTLQGSHPLTITNFLYRVQLSPSVHLHLVPQISSGEADDNENIVQPDQRQVPQDEALGDLIHRGLDIYNLSNNHDSDFLSPSIKFNLRQYMSRYRPRYLEPECYAKYSFSWTPIPPSTQSPQYPPDCDYGTYQETLPEDIWFGFGFTHTLCELSDLLDYSVICDRAMEELSLSNVRQWSFSGVIEGNALNFVDSVAKLQQGPGWGRRFGRG